MLADPCYGKNSAYNLQETFIMCKYLPQSLEIPITDPPDDLKATAGCGDDTKFLKLLPDTCLKASRVSATSLWGGIIQL